MTITLPAEDLARAATQAAGAIDPKNRMPILKCARLRIENGALAITTTNLDHALTVRVPAAGNLETVCVDACDLAAVARNLLGEVEISDGGRIAADGASYELETAAASDFPKDKSLPWSDPIMPAAELVGLLKQVAFAMSAEATRYCLSGAWVTPKRVAACDGHRLVVVPRTANGSDFPSMIVPRCAVKLLCNLPINGNGEVRVANMHVMVRSSGIDLVSRLVDGTYPDIDHLIPAADAATSRFTVASKDLARGIASVTAIMRNSEKDLKLTLVAGDSLLLLSAKSISGNAFGKVPISNAIGKIEVGFNRHYLAKLCSQAETLSFGLIDAGPTPTRIEPGDGRLFLLMPMML